MTPGRVQARQTSSRLADSQAGLAQGGHIPGQVKQAGKNTCPFHLPSWARSAHEVGKWYVSNCRGGEAQKINTL